VLNCSSAIVLAEEPYPLGVALGLSGTGAPYCKNAVEGIGIAVNEVNASGGLLGRYPSDWAVLLYDAVYILKQGVEKAGSINTDALIQSMKGMDVDTTRGRFYFREIDNQLSCSAYFGRVTDDPKYSIPIYHDLMEFKGPDIWRPAAEIEAARK